jgi:hypothetical protein
VDLKSGKRWLTQCSKLTRRLMGKSVQKGTGRSLGTTKARGTSGMAKATEDDTHPASVCGWRDGESLIRSHGNLFVLHSRFGTVEPLAQSVP